MDQTWPKQPINKTIGINKLGTLLSSQTTDTPGTTTTKQQSRIAPEQLPKLTRSRGALQTGVSAISCSDEPAPPASGTLQSEPFSGRSRKGACRYFSASAAATQKTIHAPNPHRKSTPKAAATPRKTPKPRGFRGPSAPPGRAPGRNRPLWSGSRWARPRQERAIPQLRARNTTVKSASRAASR